MFMRFFSVWLVALLVVRFEAEAADSATSSSTNKSALQLSTFDLDVTPPIGSMMAYDPVTNHWDLGLRARLAAYKVPRRVLFFRPEELRYTGNQKIQVGPLREQALARLRAEGAVMEGHTYR